MTKKYLYRTSRVGDRVHRKYLGKRSDPCVDLVGRSRRFERMTGKALFEKQHRDTALSRRIEADMKQLSASVVYWSVFSDCSSRLPSTTPPESACNLNDPSNRFFSESLAMIPKPREFARLAKAADAGDADARVQLALVLKQVPDVVAEMTDLVSVAKRNVIESLGGESFTGVAAITQAIDENVDLLMKDCGDDVLDRMFCEVLAIASLDVKRCMLATMQTHSSQREANSRSARASRATARFESVTEAFQKHRSVRRESGQ